MLPARLARCARAAVNVAKPHSAAPLPLRASSRPLARMRNSSAPFLRHFATSTTPTSSSFDPRDVAAQQALDEGTNALELGELETAATEYKKSLEIKDTAIGHYNLGVVQYQLHDLPGAIASFQSSLALTSTSVAASLPTSNPSELLSPEQTMLADLHTNLGAAYILSTPPRPDLALQHLQSALELSPDDGEVCYNLAAVLEATGEEEEALVAFQRAEKLGIERARVNIRNIGAKLLGKRLREEQAEVEAKKGEGQAEQKTGKPGTSE